MRTIKRQAFATKGAQEQGIEGVLHSAESWYERYRKQVNIAVAVVLAAAVLAGGYSVYQRGNERSASVVLAKALAQYQPAQGVQPDHAAALEQFRDVARQYSGTTSAVMARFYAGNALMAMDRTQEAITEYRALVDGMFTDAMMSGLAYQRLGYAYEAQGSRDEALKAFQKAEELLGPGMATLEQAALLERAGKPDEARKKYALLAEKLPGTPVGEEAKRKAPAVPAAPAGAAPADGKK